MKSIESVSIFWIFGGMIVATILLLVLFGIYARIRFDKKFGANMRGQTEVQPHGSRFIYKSLGYLTMIHFAMGMRNVPREALKKHFNFIDHDFQSEINGIDRFFGWTLAVAFVFFLISMPVLMVTIAYQHFFEESIPRLWIPIGFGLIVAVSTYLAERSRRKR